MINTINTKLEQLTNGYFKTGNGSEVVLIVGSCRSIPYVNYFLLFNKEYNERFTIIFIDPYNWCFDLQDNRTNLQEVITSLEQHEGLLGMLKSAKYYIHEYYTHFGMFCCDKSAEKNIYQYGLNPDIDICLPNFNDNFILFGDIVTFDAEARRKAIADYNVIGKLSEEVQYEIFQISQSNLNKFYDICLKSDFPEMKEFFQRNMKDRRMFWTYNHVSKEFTYFIFVRLMKRFLDIDLSEQFIRQVYQMPDMFANNYTYLTQFDLKWYGFNWGEEVKQLRDKL
jgi:hypothetical protein